MREAAGTEGRGDQKETASSTPKWPDHEVSEKSCKPACRGASEGTRPKDEDSEPPGDRKVRQW